MIGRVKKEILWLCCIFASCSSEKVDLWGKFFAKVLGFESSKETKEDKQFPKSRKMTSQSKVKSTQKVNQSGPSAQAQKSGSEREFASISSDAPIHTSTEGISFKKKVKNQEKTAKLLKESQTEKTDKTVAQITKEKVKDQRLLKESTQKKSKKFKKWGEGVISEEYTLPTPEKIWKSVLLVDNPEILKEGVERLKRLLVGTKSEKQQVTSYCKKKDLSLETKNLSDRIACLPILISQSAPQKSVNDKMKVTGKHIPKLNWNKLKGASFRDALKALPMKNLKTFSLIAEEALKVPPKERSLYSEAVMALILKGENLLPESIVIKKTNELYETYQEFFQGKRVLSEMIYNRMGMLYLHYSVVSNRRSYLNRASEAFLKALDAPDGVEKFRSLFWLGYLHGVNHPKKGLFFPPNRYWDRLIQEFPLNLHTAVSLRLLKKEEHFNEILNTQKEIAIYPFPEKRDLKDIDQLINYTALVLHSFGEKRAIREFERIALKYHQAHDVGMTLFLAMFFREYDRTRASLRLFEKALKKGGLELVSIDLLKYLHPYKYENWISQYNTGFLKYVVFALIKQESSFDPRAQSLVGARGLMQVMPTTAKHLSRGHTVNLFDPKLNIELGSKYLKRRIQDFDGNYLKATASYNAGILKVKDWDRIFRSPKFHLLFADLIPYPETREYGPKILMSAFFYSYFLDKQHEKTLDEILDFMTKGQNLPLGDKPIMKLEWPGGQASST